MNRSGMNQSVCRAIRRVPESTVHCCEDKNSICGGLSLAEPVVAHGGELLPRVESLNKVERRFQEGRRESLPYKTGAEPVAQETDYNRDMGQGWGCI